MAGVLTEDVAVRPLTRALRVSAPGGLRGWWRGHTRHDTHLRCTACGWELPADALLELSSAHRCVQNAPVALAPVPDPRRRRVRRASCLGVALLVVAAGLVAARGDAAGAPPPVGAARTSAIVLSGSSLSYPAARRTAAAMGWEARVFTAPGGGISRSSLDPTQSVTAVARRLLPATGPQPDVVVLQGGEADHVAPPATLQRAAEHLVDYVRAHAGPEAQLVLVGPIPGASVPDSIRTVNDVLAGVAAQRDVPFVDAVALGWTAGDPALPDALAVELRRALSGG